MSIRLVSAQIFDPLFHPQGPGLPARMEVIVERLNPDPDVQVIETDRGTWTLATYSDIFMHFWHDGDLGQKPVTDPEFNEEDLVFHEGHLNVSGVIETPVVPVTVLARGEDAPWRDYYVPVPVVERWIDDFVVPTALGRWRLLPSREWALRGQVVFEFQFVAHSIDLRAENLRQTSKK